MEKQSNIVNHEEIQSFISQLKEGASPRVSSYIDKNIANYIYRKAKTKKFIPQLSWKKQSLSTKLAISKGEKLDEVILDSELYNYLKSAIDYVNTLIAQSEESILRISVEDAVAHHEKLIILTNAKADEAEGKIHNILRFKDNFTIVKLEDKQAFHREGKLMKHCVGTYSPTENILSLRDESNHPLITFQLREKEIVQMRSSCNAAVPRKYYPYVKQLMKAKNLKIAKVVDNSPSLMSQILKPSLFTMFAFQWKSLIVFLGLSTPLSQIVEHSLISSSISLMFLICSLMEWLSFIANFSLPSSSSPRSIDFNDSEDAPLLEEKSSRFPNKF